MLKCKITRSYLQTAPGNVHLVHQKHLFNDFDVCKTTFLLYTQDIM